MKSIAIYVHWPFCKSKCHYCDFNSHVREQIDHQSWLETYKKEIFYYRDFLLNKNITSIFFGGGTPSLMPLSLIESIIKEFHTICSFDKNIEITLEANPTSIEISKFIGLASAGINRISIGIQSFNDTHLKFLGREHSAGEALKSIEIADKYFSNFSFDLIYTLPNQSLAQWEKELKFALSFAKYHISLYQLTIEKGTRFYSDFLNHKFTLPSSDESAIFYELTEKITKQNGLSPYEISNYSKPGFESKHNMSYWKYDEYIGFGPGAHSRIDRGNGLEAIVHYHLPEKWLSSITEKGHSIQTQTILSPSEVAEEFLLMNLRLINGIDKQSFQIKTGMLLEHFLNEQKLRNLEKDLFLINQTDKIILTFNGRLLLNQIINFLL
jgi:putative oxygen-independent coproporphyrinogen III oxidase